MALNEPMDPGERRGLKVLMCLYRLGHRELRRARHQFLQAQEFSSAHRKRERSPRSILYPFLVPREVRRRQQRHRPP